MQKELHMHGMKRQLGREGRRPETRGGRGFGRHGERHERGHGGGFGGGGGGGRRGKRFTGEELRLMVLALLEETTPQHGYQLIRTFAEKSGDAYAPSPGVLYPLLTLLQDMGLVEEADSTGGGSRRSYALSEAGKAEIDGQREAIASAFGRLAALAEESSRTDAGPVRRAMMNLRTAAVQRMGKDGADEEVAFSIAAILDEAAQKIERL
jgi:DNA-binding PadR family transcriptional regulator